MTMKHFPLKLIGRSTPVWLPYRPVDVLGVTMYIHPSPVDGAGWTVTEPDTGLRVENRPTSRAAVHAARQRCVALGGVDAILRAVTSPNSPRLPSRAVHDPAFIYGAGGPLDAPDEMPAGSTLIERYRDAPSSRTVWRALT